MSRAGERSTFLKIAEIVERTRRYTERAHDLLISGLRERNPDQRTLIFLGMLERERGAFEAAIDASLERTPQLVLDTRVQYSTDPWTTDLESPSGNSIEEATRWILDLDDRILQVYRELAETVESDAVREFLESLAELVRAHDRRLSREAQNAYDV